MSHLHVEIKMAPQGQGSQASEDLVGKLTLARNAAELYESKAKYMEKQIRRLLREIKQTKLKTRDHQKLNDEMASHVSLTQESIRANDLLHRKLVS